MATRSNAFLFVTSLLLITSAAAALNPRIHLRQNSLEEVPSSSSYNYWWPYPPWGADTALSSPTSNQWQPASTTTVWWTPPITSETAMSSPTPEVTQTSTGTLASTTEAPSNKSSDSLTDVPSESPVSSTSDSTMPSPTASASTSANSQSSRHTSKSANIISTFVVCGLVGLFGIAFYVTNRWQSDQQWGSPNDMSRLESGDIEDEKATLSYTEAGQHERDALNTPPWWSAQKYLPALNGASKYFRLGNPRTNAEPSSSNRPPFSFPDLLSSPDPKTTHLNQREYRQLNPATYGYGQWHERSLGQYINPATSNLSRAYSREGDAEELEIDLSKGWRHYSSMYGGSPEPEMQTGKSSSSLISSSRKHGRNLSKETSEVLGGRADDKFTSLPRRDPADDRPSTRTRGSGSTTSKGSATDSFTTVQYTHRTEHRRYPSYSSDEEEAEETTAAFTTTPRSANGGIRHKSIRRVIAEQMSEIAVVSPFERALTRDNDPFADSASYSPRPLSADQMSLNDMPPAPMPLRVTSKRQEKSQPQSVSDVVRANDQRVRERKETGTEVEEDIGLSEVEALVEPPKRPVVRMNTKYRRTQQWLKDAPGTNEDITLARAAFLSRATTLASTIPSVYSPETDHWAPSPKAVDHQPVDQTKVNGLGLEYDDDSDVLSAADMGKAARGRYTGDEKDKRPLQFGRSKSPLPELPSEITSPPLEADLFFSDRPPPSSPPRRPATATKVPGGGEYESMPLKLKANRRLHSPRNSPLKNHGASPTTTRSLAAPAPTSTRLMGPAGGGSLARTITNRSVTPPPSHFTSKARAEANSKVEMIVQRSWEAKDQSERPVSPTGFGARSESDVKPPPVLWRQSGAGGLAFGGYSPVPDGVDGAGYAGGIEQRLALLRDNGFQ